MKQRLGGTAPRGGGAATDRANPVYLFGRCFGHDGGDPAVATIAQRLSAADLSVVVLCNVKVPVLAARNQLLAAATGA
jgi:hypothetical protein